MFESPQGRLAMLVGAVCVLGGLLVYGGTVEPNPGVGAYPAPSDYAASQEAYVGQQVTASGIVTSEDPIVVRVEDDRGRNVEFELDGVDHYVERGDGIRVFGVLREGGRISVVRSFRVEIRGLWYAYVVSFLAGLWALSLLVRTWRFDVDELGLVPRERPKTLEAVIRGRSGGDEDG